MQPAPCRPCKPATCALGRIKYADLFADQPDDLRPMLLEAHIEEASARQLRNLSLQESRLTRKRERAIEELKEIQTERKKQREQELETAAKMYERFEEENLDFDPAQFGFEFSIDEIEERVGYREGLRIRCPYPKQYGKYIAGKLLRDERLGLFGKGRGLKHDPPQTDRILDTEPGSVSDLIRVNEHPPCARPPIRSHERSNRVPKR